MSTRLAIVVALALVLLGVGWSVVRVARSETDAVRVASNPESDVRPQSTASPAPAAIPSPSRATLGAPSASPDAAVLARLAAIEKRLDAMEKSAGADRAVLTAAKTSLDDLVRESVRAHEGAAIATCRNVIAAQAQFQQTARCDVDSDGTGEYGGFLEMSGAVPGRMRERLVPPVLSSAFQSLNANGEVLRGGYLYRLYLPNAAGAGIGEPAAGFTPAMIDANRAETTWCVYAWPEDYGRTGQRTFFANQNGDVFATEFSGYSGTGAGPTPDGAFRAAGSAGGSITGAVAIETVASDSHTWKQVN